MVATHIATGSSGEEAAANYLCRMGYRIQARNWRQAQLEIDIVAEHNQCVVFVEVKTRSKGSMARPHDALTKSKQQKLIAAAQHYLTRHNLWDVPSRFDLIAVIKDGSNFHVEHIEHAFDLSEPVGGGNTTWQPW